MSLRRALVIARRIADGFRRDHRSLALLFVAPIVISALLGWIVTAGEARLPRVAVAVADAPLRGPVTDALYAADGDSLAFVGLADDAQAGRALVRDDRADVLIDVPAGTLEAVLRQAAPRIVVVTAGIDGVAEGGWLPSVHAALSAAFAAGTPGAPPVALPELVHETVYGSPDGDQLDALGPVFLGFFAYFFVFILTGISFLRERIGGTLERLLATPVRPSEVIAGYSAGFGLFAAIQVLLLLGFALLDVRTPAVGPVPELRIGLGVANAGSPLLVFLVVLLLGLGSVNLGILVSTFARTELQVLQFIPLVIVPQGLLAGLLWPVASLPPALEALSRVMPMRYGIEGLRAVMVRGAGLEDPALQGDLLVLAGLAFVFVALAGRTVRREVA